MTEVAINMMVDHLVTELTQHMITDVSDETKVATLRAGKLQSDPTSGNGLNVLIYAPDDERPSKLYTEQSGLESPIGEIGGGWWYLHPFRLRFILHFAGENDRDVARTKAQTILSRARWALMQIHMPKHPSTNLSKDDFDETLVEIKVKDFWLNEAGGPQHFIWNGWLEFDLLTEQTARNFDTYFS